MTDETPEPELTPEQEASILQAKDETLNPTPEENFWDDRTTPTAYSRSDSEQEMAFNPLQTWDEVVRDLGEPNLGPYAGMLGIPEEDLDR